jgi:hypothetical protein
MQQTSDHRFQDHGRGEGEDIVEENANATRLDEQHGIEQRQLAEERQRPQLHLVPVGLPIETKGDKGSCQGRRELPRPPGNAEDPLAKTDGLCSLSRVVENEFQATDDQVGQLERVEKGQVGGRSEKVTENT